MTNRPVFAWALVLGVVLLGPALGPGYLLTYDLVWVPDLVLRSDFLGIGSALPRAVPSDAVVAVLDEVIPGALLEKVVLLGGVIGGGAGMARLLRDRSRLAQAVSVSFYVWSPLVVERLLLGAWPVLIGYAVLPWVLLEARRWRETGRFPASLPLLVVLGSLSASAGLVTAVALVATVAGRLGWKRWSSLLAVVSGANAPWIVSGLLHVGSATTDAAAGRLFALSDEGPIPGPVAALTGGGVWNSEVVPSSRTGVWGIVAVVLLVVLVGSGLRSWARWLGPRDVVAWSVCWGIGWGVATLTWAAPALTGALAAEVPGGGLIRDGSRLLVLGAPATAAVMGLGADRIRHRVGSEIPRAVVGALLVVAPILVLSDAAYGVGGRLQPVDYPAAYDVARVALEEAGPGDLLLLPLSNYRQPSWNNGAKVLDPTGRFFARDYVASDELIVAGETLAGEDPRVPRVREALAGTTAQDRSDALVGLGIGFVAIDPEVSVEVPSVAGEVLVDEAELRLVRLDSDLGVQDEVTPTGWVAAMAAAWSAFLLTLGWGPGLAVRNRLRKKR